MQAIDDKLGLGVRLTQEVINPMKRTFVGKDEVIDVLAVCLTAGENLFILGPPGTAKTAIVHEIGARLFLALDTVKGHNRRIFDKLQVQRRTEAVARARELGLL